MIVNANSIVQLAIHHQKWNYKTYPCEWKNYCTYRKDYSWNPNTCTCENSKYLKHISDGSKIVCDEIIYVMDIVSTIVTSTNSINSNDKVR